MKAQRIKIDSEQYGIDIVLSVDEISDYAKSIIEQHASESVAARLVTTYTEEVTNEDGEAVVSSSSQASPSIGDTHFLIPEAALATYKQLLGTNSDRETIQYLMYIREHGEPEVESDGTNAWTSAYEELESKLGLRSAKGISEVEAEDEDESALASAAVKVSTLASAIVKASTNLLSTVSADSDEEELTGIDKTRSKLGLPSRVVSREMKIQLLSLASANVMAEDDTSDLVSSDTFYEIPDDVLDLFDQDVIAEAEANFLDALTLVKW